MPEDAPLIECLAEVSRFFVGDRTLKETLDRVAQLTVVAVAPADLVGLTLLLDGRHRTAVFTDTTAPEIDESQYDRGDGPCLESFRTGRLVDIESTLDLGRWPEFRQIAAAHGVHSTCSLPLVGSERNVGAMNMYCNRERGFTDADRDTAIRFAAQAAVALSNAQTYWGAQELSGRLADAMKSRAIIEQAKGMLMAAQRCTAEEAFDLLLRASQRENIKLRDIASRIVDNAISGNPEPARKATPSLS